MVDVLVRLVSVKLRQVTVCFSQVTEGKQVSIKPLSCQRDDQSITERRRVNTYTGKFRMGIFNVLDLVEV